MLRKNRLKCESISARLFLACHQKFNAFKCKQFCCAKPTLAHLLADSFPLYPRERRAAVHGLCFSVGSSAHSPVNSLRSNSTGNVAEAPPVADEARRCWRKTRSITPAPRAIGDYVLRGLCGGLQSKPFPRSSQLGCTTAARLLETYSSRFIKSLALPFLLFFFHNFRFAVPYTQKSYPRDFPRVGLLFYAYKPAGGILKMGRSLGDLLHGDLFFSELTLILILIVVLGLAVEGAVGGKGYYRAAAL